MHVELSEEFERGLSLLWSCHPLEDPGEASLESSDPADKHFAGTFQTGRDGYGQIRHGCLQVSFPSLPALHTGAARCGFSPLCLCSKAVAPLWFPMGTVFR